MRLLLLLSLFISLRYHHTSRQVTVPEKMMYCGIELTLTEGAQEKIQQHVKKLYENPRYFNLAVDKAETYMPFIEEAFQDAGVPDDLKYLAIQESNLQAEAVSSSNAVGFWQFKADPAREMGLRIDSLLDERKHIFRSSQAAATYFNRANADFNNWIYAVIAYYEGLTGGVQHTNPEYYGKKQMTVDENLHWYAMRALAYKIAYEEGMRISSAPKTWLEPQLATGPITLKELAQKHSVKEDDLFRANVWMVGKRIPIEVSATYYLLRTGGYTAHKNDPAKFLPKTKPQPVVASNTPKPTPIATPPIIAKIDSPKNVETPSEVLPTPRPTASTSVNKQPLPTFSQPTEKSPAVSPQDLPPSAIATYNIEEDPLYDQEFT
ncbi:MAG: transglycosylase SLT domain-containing protein, partial [Bacteroidia bacterium]